MTILPGYQWINDPAAMRNVAYDDRFQRSINSGGVFVNVNGKTADLVVDVVRELAIARAKFHVHNTTMLDLVEQVGNLAKATSERSSSDVRMAAVRVAALAMCVTLDGDETLDAKRASRGLDSLVSPAADPKAE